LEQVGLAQLVVWVEAASGRDSRRDLDPAGGGTDRGQSGRQRGGPLLLLAPLPGEVRYVLGDTHYNDPELRHQCHQRGGELVATRRGPHPHRDAGVEVRMVFHKLRSQAIELFNGLFKNIFEWRMQMPVKGLQRSQLLALGAVVVYQLVLLYQHERNLPLGKGIKPLLRAA
jgi:hypothetical protein